MTYGNAPTGRLAIERRIVHRAWADPDYRRRLFADPRTALGEELGVRIPEDIRVSVVEERSDHLCIVIPLDLSPITWEAGVAMTGET